VRISDRDVNGRSSFLAGCSHKLILGNMMMCQAPPKESELDDAETFFK